MSANLPFFFYGSLRHTPLLEIVLSRKVDPADIEPAVLPVAIGQPHFGTGFPLIVLGYGEGAEGVIVSGLGSSDYARLDFFEWAEGYAPREITLANGQIALC